MKDSTVLSAVERRKLLGPEKPSLFPLGSQKKIWKSSRRSRMLIHGKYQQLMVMAVEQFLDRYYEAMKSGKKSANGGDSERRVGVWEVCGTFAQR